MATVNEKMTAIADAIRSKTGGTEVLTLDDMASGVNEVYEAGKNKTLISTITIASATTNCGQINALLSSYADTNKFIYCEKKNPKLDGTINNEFIEYGYAYDKLFARRFRNGAASVITGSGPTSTGYDCILKVGDIVEIYEVELCDALR